MEGAGTKRTQRGVSLNPGSLIWARGGNDKSDGDGYGNVR